MQPMRLNLRFLTFAGALVALLPFGHEQFGTLLESLFEIRPNRQSTEILLGDRQTPGNLSYPRTVSFRRGEFNAALGQPWMPGAPDTPVSLERLTQDWLGHDAVILKIFSEEAKDNQFRKIQPILKTFKCKHLKTPILAHVNAAKAIRPGTGGKAKGDYDPQNIFPGHFQYYPGSSLTTNVNATATTLTVSDISRYRVGDDVRLVAKAGTALTPQTWNNSEVVRVTAINAGTKTLTVRRGEYFTTAQAFSSGAQAFPHVMTFVSEYPQWNYNYSPRAPKDESGRSFPQAFAANLAQSFKALTCPTGEPVVNGIELDITSFHLEYGKRLEGEKRHSDTNLDGAADQGMDDGFPLFGFGTVEFVQSLRQQMGPDFIILGDSIHTLWRPVQYANGFDNESFPDLRSERRISGAIARTQNWLSTGQYPWFSVIFSRGNFDKLPGQKDSYQVLRHTLGVATLFGMHHGTNRVTDNAPTLMDPRPDEYVGGPLKQQHWLGAPLGPAVMVPSFNKAQNLISYGDFETPAARSTVRLQARPGYKAELKSQASNPSGQSLRLDVQTLPANPDNVGHSGVQLALPFTPQGTGEYTLVFKARADHDWGRLSAANAETPVGLRVHLSNQDSDHRILVTKEWQEFHISVPAPKTPGAKPTFILDMGEEKASLLIDQVRIYKGSANRYYRRFQKGLVVVNASKSPLQMSLNTLEPTRTLTRLQATQEKGIWLSDPALNNGQRVDKTKPLTVPPLDAIFLRAQ